MKEVDFIIVGCGLAGIAFCEQLRVNNKTFMVFDNASQHSSKVAAGLYNPVILKRFTKVWNAQSQLELALPKYKKLEELLNVKLNYKLPVYRKFTSIEEQNEWFVASDKPVLEDFLSTYLKKNTYPSVLAEFGFGEVLGSGRIDTAQLVKSYLEFLLDENKFVNETFQYERLKMETESIQYGTINSKYVVCAEGFGLLKNPFFNYLPLNGTKGEMLIIKAPDLKLDVILKSSVFVVPLGDDRYWVGATYEREDKSHQSTREAKEKLLLKLKTLINCNFDVVKHVAGIRPTTKDRRPLVGSHPKYKNLLILNGLGTRGVMISPFVAEQLYNHVELQESLDPEIDISRFTKPLKY